MNQQQSKLLEQEGTNEQEAKDVATQDTEEIPSYFCTYFSAIVAASTGQFKAQIMFGMADAILEGKSM